MKTTPRLIADFIANEFSTSFVVDVVESVSVGSGETPRYKLTTCEPTYAYVGALVNSEYRVVAIGENYLTVESNDVLTVGTYTLNAPLFLHGTQAAVSAKILQIKKENIQYPLIYLQEILQDRMIADVMSRVGKVSDLHLWFVIPSKDGKEVTEDKHDRYITPMLQLCESFIKQIQLGEAFGLIESDWVIRYHTSIGSASEYSYLKNLFTIPLAGIELNVSVPVQKKYCSC